MIDIRFDPRAGRGGWIELQTYRISVMAHFDKMVKLPLVVSSDFQTTVESD